MEDSSTTDTSFLAKCDAKASSITKSHETRSTRKEHGKLPKFETFNYDPLPKEPDAIRLLKLVPSKSTDPDVECEIITPTKEEREIYGYEALSSCWDTEKKDAICQHSPARTHSCKVYLPEPTLCVKSAATYSQLSVPMD